MHFSHVPQAKSISVGLSCSQRTDEKDAQCWGNNVAGISPTCETYFSQANKESSRLRECHSRYGEITCLAWITQQSVVHVFMLSFIYSNYIYMHSQVERFVEKQIEGITRTKLVSRATQTLSIVPPETTPVVSPVVTTRHQMTQTTSELEPYAGTYTTSDRVKQQCINAQERLDKCMRPGYHWTSEMIVVMLRFLYHLVVGVNWTWTQACYKTSTIFKLKTNTVFSLAKSHRNSTLNWPAGLS